MNSVSNVVSTLLGGRAPFSLVVDGVAELPRVVRFSGREAVSELYEFTVEFAGGELDLAQMIGKAATLQLDGLGPPRLIHGEIASVEYIGDSRRYQLYELVLVPRVWRLLHRQGSRIFQNKTTAEVVAAVFKDAGLGREDFRFELAAAYGPRNYCVQYRESDLAFVCRLLEEDGIHYFFEHRESRATMVLTDHAQAHPPIVGETAVWNHESGELRDREHVSGLRLVERVRPGKVSLRDFNFHKPTQKTEADASGKRDVDLEVYDYPGEFQDPSAGGPHQGQALAKIRLEELQLMRRQASGASDCMRLVPGHVFAVEGHRRADLNGPRVLMQVTHQGTQTQALDEDAAEGSFHYGNQFVCVDKQVPLRPPRMTPRPVVRGVQSATVVGPAGEEIHVDEHGRVLVQFHWDRQGQHDERSSCWVRVSQSWAGAGWGAMFIPRIGHEVLVDFIEGDPDRPIVTGRVYHGENATPYPLPDEKTKSTIKSESSPGGGGFNELRFEDRKGSEEVFFHAQKDLNEVVLNNNSRAVTVDQTFTVGGNQTFTITGDRSVTVTEGDESLTVSTGKSTTTIEQDRSVTVKSGDSSLTVESGTHTMTVKQAITGTSQTANIGLTAKTGISLTAETADLTATAQAAVAITAKTRTMSLTALQDVALASQTARLSLSGKKEVALVSATSTLTMGSKEKATLASSDAVNILAVNTISVGSETVDVQGKKIVLTGAEEITLQVGASAITIKADGVTISGPKITSSAIGMHTISGALIKIN
ncbi:type VI secretion system tip protein TssI/VgrG [Nannocystis bainbridge]|uniref:Type VI secretion system tip protein TssI/VgrG n=1 Tax=Nannocystis bainbridge TaxID=2995303 RepID=A0ABT5E3P2_9BACT|nr:type VI secretion system tip protein TssI/VgrG [Nannocystis bainbridge]MDC0720491.1 type VI secretion system tip protein TssI/VgrG [Nannocystis bainbridge]